MCRVLLTISVLCLAAAKASAQGAGDRFTAVQSDTQPSAEMDQRCPGNPEAFDCSRPWETKPYGTLLEYKPMPGVINRDTRVLIARLDRFRRYARSPTPLISLFGHAGVYELAEAYARANQMDLITQQTNEAVKYARAHLTEVQPSDVAFCCASIHRLRGMNRDPNVTGFTRKFITRIDESQLARDDALLLLLVAEDYRKAGDAETAGIIQEVVDRYQQRARLANEPAEISPLAYRDVLEKIESNEFEPARRTFRGAVKPNGH
jgi:hypothetical protein